MRNLLVTGGAGFIGANFVHYWLDRASGRPGRGARRAHLCRQPREPRAGARASGAHLRARRHPHARSGRAAAARARDHDRSSTSRPSRTWTARSTGPDAFIDTNVRRHPRAAQGRARSVAGARAPGEPMCASTMSRPTRSMARSARRSAVHREHTLRAQLAICREQGRLATTWSAPTTTPTDFRSPPATAPTTTGPTSFPRS